MHLSQFISILYARKLIAIWVLGVTVTVTTVVSFLLPKTYMATAAVVVNSKSADPITGSLLPSAMMPGYMATQLDIIQSENVALKVVDKLKIIENPTARLQFEKATKGQGDIRTWFAKQFLENLEIKPSRESTVIELSYLGVDPQFSAAMANAFAEAYIKANLELKTEPAKQSAQWFDQQLKQLRQNVEVAQNRLSTYQKEHGIAFAGERLDTESARLAELSSQLTAAQSQRFEAESRSKQVGHHGDNNAQEVLSNGLIQGLKAQLTQAEARLSDVSERLGQNHPQYIAAKAEVENIRNTIAREISKTSESVSKVASATQMKEGEIEAALAEQKDKVLKLKSEQDEIAVLMRDLEGAQRVYDLAMQRYSQTRLESQSVQTDISILNPAVAPLKHYSPKITINILLSVLLGTVLAIAFAMVAEMLDRRVRTPEDALQALSIPVLGVIVRRRVEPVTWRTKLKGWLGLRRYAKGISMNLSTNEQ